MTLTKKEIAILRELLNDRISAYVMAFNDFQEYTNLEEKLMEELKNIQ